MPDEDKQKAYDWVKNLCPNADWKEYLLGLIAGDGFTPAE